MAAAKLCFWMIGSTRDRGRGSGSGARGLSRRCWRRNFPGRCRVRALWSAQARRGRGGAVGCRRAPRASRADMTGHVWQDADRRAARSVDRRGRQDARMAERFAARLAWAAVPAADALIAGAYLAGTNTRRVRRALNAVFAGPVGKDVVSRVWRKTKKGDWDAWNARSLAEEPIVRLILDGTVASCPARQKGDLDLVARGAWRARRRSEDAARDQEHGRGRRGGLEACAARRSGPARIANAGAGRHRRPQHRASKRRWRRCGPTWLSNAAPCTSIAISSPTRPSACTRKSRTTTAT